MSPSLDSHSPLPHGRQSIFPPVCLSVPLTPEPSGFSLDVDTLLSTPQQAPPLAPGTNLGLLQPWSRSQSALPAGCPHLRGQNLLPPVSFQSLGLDMPPPPHLWPCLTSGQDDRETEWQEQQQQQLGLHSRAPGPGPDLLSLFRQGPSEPLWSGKATSSASTALLPPGPAARLSLSCFLSHTMSWTPY